MTERRWLILGVTLIAIAALWWGAQFTRRTGEQLRHAPAETITVRFFRNPKPVASFTAAALDGGMVSSAGWRGKVTIVNFWATWCPPCRAEIPDLIALQEKYGDQLRIIGVSTDEGGRDEVRRFVADRRMNYPVVMVTPEIERAFGRIYALPTSFIIDREGRVVQKHVGMLNPTVAEQETRALAGLDTAARIEQVDDPGTVKLGANAQATDIPGIDVSRLSAGIRATVLQRLNAEPCTCGCGLTVAQCRIDDPSCNVSLPLAQRIVAEAAAR